METKPGIYRLSNHEYHQSDGLSCTHLKELIKSGAHYQAWLCSEKKESEEMLIGKAVHAKLLEPETFDTLFVQLPDKEFRTKSGDIAKNPWATTEGKLFLSQFYKEHEGKTLLTKEQSETVDNVVKALEEKVLFHPELSRLFDGEKELSIYWECPETGLTFKCRPDVLTKTGIVTDLKVVTDASDNEIQKTIAKQLYFMQAPHYLEGIQALRAAGHDVPEPKHFVFVFIEREAPHEVNCVYLDELSLNFGRGLLKRAKLNYSQAKKTGKWNGFERKIHQISIPNWALYAYGQIAE